MNQLPSMYESEEDEDTKEEAPTLQLVGSKQEHAHKGVDADQKRAFPEVSLQAYNEEESGFARKKLCLSKEQLALLEESFKEHSTLNPIIPSYMLVCVIS